MRTIALRSVINGDALPMAKVDDPYFGDAHSEVCLFCMQPTPAGHAYCSENCKQSDEVSSESTFDPVAADFSPVPALVSGNASSTCSSTPSSTNNSPAHGPLPPDAVDEPSQLSLPPPLTKPRSTLLNFNYSYSYEGAALEPSSLDALSNKSSSATPEAIPAYSRRTSMALSPELQPVKALPPPPPISRRSSFASPRIRPVLTMSPRLRPTATPPLKPLTAMANLSIGRRSEHGSPALRPISPPQAVLMARRSSAPLVGPTASLIEADEVDENAADDEAGSSAFAHFLFNKTRRPSSHLATEIELPASAPTAPTATVPRSSSVGPTMRRFLYGRASSASKSDASMAEDRTSGRGRSRQREVDGSAAHRSPSPTRGRSRSTNASSASRSRSPRSSPDASDDRGRRARRRDA